MSNEASERIHAKKTPASTPGNGPMRVPSRAADVETLVAQIRQFQHRLLNESEEEDPLDIDLSWLKTERRN